MMGHGKKTADSGHATSRRNWHGAASNLLGSTVFNGDMEWAIDD
jgi:hypothetical protein